MGPQAGDEGGFKVDGPVHTDLLMDVPGTPLLLMGRYRFLTVMLIPKLSIMMNDVSRAGSLVMALM